MTCQACVHYFSSTEANKPRDGLEGYGYCKAAPSIESRSRIFRDTTAKCWLNNDRFQAIRTQPAEVAGNVTQKAVLNGK